MISLYNTLKESLLSGYDDLEKSTNPIKAIRQFIKDNYKTQGILQISKEPNENGKYEVSCLNVMVNKAKLLSLTSLTNGMFEWGVINGEFDCSGCHYLTSLEGAPKEVGGSFNCKSCESLTSLEGAPKEVGRSFNCKSCESLTSLEGAPKKVGLDFECYGCDSLTSLEYAPKKVRGDFNCSYCGKFKSLEGAPKEVGDTFNCTHCKSLTSLKGAPKEVGGHFICYNCGAKFTEEDVRKVCGVKGKIMI